MTSNLDSGSGVLLWLRLKQARALRKHSNGFYRMDRQRMTEALQSLVLTIEELERQGDATYLIRAKTFVQEHLPSPARSDVDAKFSIPCGYDLIDMRNRLFELRRGVCE